MKAQPDGVVSGFGGRHFAGLAPVAIDQDPERKAEADALPREEDRMLFGEWAHSSVTTFRTWAHLQIGLLSEPGEDGVWYLPLRLVNRAPRELLISRQQVDRRR